ncbi:hypothetical protein B484DRAFT_410774, partial [Ochromonadaceae sp. CCMP2298]
QLNSFGPSTSTPLTLPYSMFVGQSATYTVSLTVVSFLGTSHSSSTTFTRSRDVVSISPGSVLTLFSAVSQPSCKEALSTLTYNWTIIKDGEEGPSNHPSTSTNPSKYLVPAYTFQ